MEDIRLKELRYIIESFNQSRNLTDVALRNILEFVDYTEMRFDKVVADHKAVAEKMQNKIAELEKKLQNSITLPKEKIVVGQCCDPGMIKIFEGHTFANLIVDLEAKGIK